MLMILSASMFKSKLTGRKPPLDLLSLPKYAHDELGLNGLALPTDLLKGWDAARLEKLRQSADKAACPALLLYEVKDQPLVSGKRADTAVDRLIRVLYATDRLGCSSVGFSIAAPDDESIMDNVADRLKQLMKVAERLGVNMLIRPTAGLTSSPERMAELIQLVGGFRIGSLPDFEAAAQSDDAHSYMRRLAPYAPVLFGSSREFTKRGRHTAYDLTACVRALIDVGYDAAIAIEYRGDDDLAVGVAHTRDLIQRLYDKAKDDAKEKASEKAKAKQMKADP
jgi:sugar phosphate isomerase/epimerase